MDFRTWTLSLVYFFQNLTNLFVFNVSIFSSEFDRLMDKHAKVTGLPVIVDFYSDGCGPCRMIAPIFKKLAKEKEGQAVFVKVDTNAMVSPRALQVSQLVLCHF